MTLRQRQSIFALNFAKLILWAYDNGYEITGGAWWRNGDRLLHGDRLAGDLNLFKDGKYLTATEDHEPLGRHWESLHEDNRWGGDFNDGNHYSMKDGVTNRR